MNSTIRKYYLLNFLFIIVFIFFGIKYSSASSEIENRQKYLLSYAGYSKFNDFVIDLQGTFQREFGLGFKQLDFDDPEDRITLIEYWTDNSDHNSLIDDVVNGEPKSVQHLQAVIGRPITGKLSDNDAACAIEYFEDQEINFDLYRSYFISEDFNKYTIDEKSMSISIRNSTFPFVQYKDFGFSLRDASHSKIINYFVYKDNFNNYKKLVKNIDKKSIIGKTSNIFPNSDIDGCDGGGNSGSDSFSRRDVYKAVRRHYPDVLCNDPKILLSALSNQSSGIAAATALAGSLQAEARGALCSISFTFGWKITLDIVPDRISDVECDGNDFGQTCNFTIHHGCRWESSDYSDSATQQNKLLYGPLCAAIKAPKPVSARVSKLNGVWSIKGKINGLQR
jgi:hypothetical protein